MRHAQVCKPQLRSISPVLVSNSYQLGSRGKLALPAGGKLRSYGNFACGKILLAISRMHSSTYMVPSLPVSRIRPGKFSQLIYIGFESLNKRLDQIEIPGSHTEDLGPYLTLWEK